MAIQSGGESRAPEQRTISDMHAEIAAAPGFRGHSAIELIWRFLYVFVGNAMELKAHLESLEDPAVALPAMSNAPEYSEANEKFDRELVRRLHNFASSVKSLIDLTRNVVAEMYPDGELRAEYDRRTKEFAANPRRRLVQQLRNYVLHNRLAPTIESSKFARVEGGNRFAMTNQILLDYRTLLERGKKCFDAGVRQLLESDAELDLLDLVNEYLAQVGEFHVWLYEAQHREHKDDIDTTNALIEEFKREIGQPPEWDLPQDR